MNRLTEWIENHQVVAFFMIAFAITWGLGFSYDAVQNKGIYLLAPLVFVATCGPALAGIIITAVSNHQPRQGRRKTFWIAFCVAWVVSALVFIANNTFLNKAPLAPILIVFSVISVLPVAFVISQAFSRNPAVKKYLTSLIRLRGVWGWALLALLLIPALILLTFPISGLLARRLITPRLLPNLGLGLIGLVVIKFFYQLFFFNATGEEAGWRGFALPRLQARFSPLVAGLILAFFWPPWHLFLWHAEGQPILTWQFWAESYANHLPATLLIVWIFNRSKGSILAAGILHAAANTAFAFINNLNWPVYVVITIVVALVVILIDRMWKKLPPDHPAVTGSP